MQVDKPKPWLSVKDAAESLGLGATAVYQLVASGALACYRIGPNRGRIRFKPEDISAYLEGCRCGPAPKAAPSPPRPRYVPEFDLEGRRRYVPEFDTAKRGRR